MAIGNLYVGIRIKMRPWTSAVYRAARWLPSPMGCALAWSLWPAIKRWGFEVTVQ